MTQRRASESRDVYRWRLADQQRRSSRQLRYLEAGTRFSFGATTGATGRPREGWCGVVVGPGEQGGVVVELDPRLGWDRGHREEWSGAVYVPPQTGEAA